MCMVSVIYDYGKNIPISTWNQTTFNEFKEIIRRLDELDKKLEEPECHDPTKAAWVRDVEERLKKLEDSNI